MKQVIVFPLGCLGENDKKILEDADFLCLEAKDPNKIVMLMPNACTITPDKLLGAALKGLSTDHNACSEMVKELYKLLNPPPAKK